MKRSTMNALIRSAAACFQKHGWAWPPGVVFEVTDFGLGKIDEAALVEVSLASYPEYGEKILYAKKGQYTPAHTHKQKKEDIICRWGELEVRVWPNAPGKPQSAKTVSVSLNNKMVELEAGKPFRLPAGHRVTMTANVWHDFVPVSDECILGEVSTAVDEMHDNFFADPKIDLFLPVEEDEAAYQPG